MAERERLPPLELGLPATVLLIAFAIFAGHIVGDAYGDTARATWDAFWNW